MELPSKLYVVIEYYDYRKEVSVEIKKIFVSRDNAKAYIKELSRKKKDCETCMERMEQREPEESEDNSDEDSELEKELTTKSDPIDNSELSETCSCYDHSDYNYVDICGNVLVQYHISNGMSAALVEV